MNPTKTQPQRIPLAVAHLAIAVSVSFAPPLHAEDEISAQEIIAQEILARSQKAMQPPIQYTLRSNGVSVFVKEKIMADGSHAVRTEMNEPIKRISINVGDDSYEYYPSHGVMIDTGFLLESLRVLKEKASATLDGVGQSQAIVKGTVVRNGRDCYEVESPVPPETQQIVGGLLPPEVAHKIPARYTYVIDKETYKMVETEVYTARGALISKSQFSEVMHNASLSEDLFLPPDGIDVELPRSTQEYFTMLVDAFRPDMTVWEREAAEIVRQSKERSARRLEQSQKTRDARITNARSEAYRALARRSSRSVLTPRKMWTVLILLQLLSFALFYAASRARRMQKELELLAEKTK